MKFINEALKKYNVTLESVLKDYPDGYVPTGRLKGKKPETKHWTEYYTFDSEEEFNSWKNFCLKHMSKEDFNVLDMTQGLAQPYLFKNID